MGNFLFITSENNWEIIKKENIMGLSERSGAIFFPKIKINDKCIIYVTKISALSGIFEIISKNVEKKVKWDNRNYDYLLKLKPVITLENPITIREHVKKLAFIKNKEKWYTYFRFPKQIPDEDVKYILEIMKKKK